MARLPRFTIPGQPQHVIQRGNNRTRMFDTVSDYRFFRECLLADASRFECAIHAYVFMTNHVHLLLSPHGPTGISKLMQCVGRRYVRYFNDRYGRTGTLWEGRYRATVIDCDRYLFTCSRYIEENPIRAGIVADPSHYSWSSYRANALGMRDELISPHGLYMALGDSESSRQFAYRAMFVATSDASSLDLIRSATNHAWALGDDRFRRAMSRFGRRANRLQRGPSSALRRARSQLPL